MAIDNPKYQKMLDNLIKVSKKNLSSVNEPLLTKAFELSLEAHKHDLRASGEPYFTHPYEVAMVVAEEFPLDDITIVSALLHDVVEDTEWTIEKLEAEGFNADVIIAVKLLTQKYNEYGISCDLINQGACESFAEDLYAYLKETGIVGEILSDGLFYDPFEDLPLYTIQLLLQQALDLYKNGAVKVRV